MKMSAILAVIAIIACCYGYVTHKNNEILQQKLDIAISQASSVSDRQLMFDGIHKEMDAVAAELDAVSKDSFRVYLDSNVPDDAIRMLKQHSPNQLQ